MRKHHVTGIHAVLVIVLLGGGLKRAAAATYTEIRVPGSVSTTGKAHLSKEKNGNLKLKVVVRHLAKPGALTPSRQTYVVWTMGAECWGPAPRVLLLYQSMR